MVDVVTVTMNPSIDISSTVERVMPTRKLRCTPEHRDPGGGGINVARVLQRFGIDVAAAYPAGGSSGRLLHRLLDAERISSLEVEIAGGTREDFTILDRGTGEQFRFVLPGPRMTRAELQQVLNRIAALTPTPGFVVASGSLPPGAPDSLYAEVGAIAKHIGSRFVLDSSGAALRCALEAGVYLVKPSLRELGELLGRELGSESDWHRAAAELVRSGKAEIVALTLGERGALLATARGVLRAEVPPVEVVSIVGAGDCFLGGMLASLVRDGRLAEAFRFGVAAGSAAVQMPGTALCVRGDVERLVGKVKLIEERLDA